MMSDGGDTSEGCVRTLTAGPAAARQRLDKVLSEALPALSRMRIKALIEQGHARVSARTVLEPSHRVKPGDEIALTVPPAAEARPRAQAMPLAVVYEDAHLIVIDKPAGLVVHPAPGNPDRTLVNALLAHCGASLSGIGGVRRPGIVHRLDKDTSGLLVAAKDDAAHTGLSALFQRHDIARAYRALVWGRPPAARGRIEGAIGRHRANRKKMAVVAQGGKPAVTSYSVRRRFGALAAELECRLETGRTHQIRVHMAHIGTPVIGDPLYGRARRGRRGTLDEALKAALEGLGRQALHAAELGFRHPLTGENLQFSSEPPDDMCAVMRALDGALGEQPEHHR